MMDWKNILADVDDDYLIGLSNKGIVKRSYKDMEAGTATVESTEEEAVVKVEAETCTIRYPLGESGCTCPSRTICRHVVHAVLALKAYVAENCAVEDCAAEECAAEDCAAEPEAGASPVWEEILAYSVEKLKKKLGARRFQSFVNLVLSGIRAEIAESSIITVQLPEQHMTVKLLSPLDYSTCTCHKKELCEHKAAAILWCLLKRGSLPQEMLQKQMEEMPELDLQRVREAAEEMKGFLEELLDTGLARISPDVPEQLERLAVICHNARLSRFEGYCRNLAENYGRYLKRMASFRTQDLAGQLARLYKRTCGLLASQSPGDIAGYAGSFRTEYLPAGTLELIGIALEHFEGRSGYEGDTCYFLEEKSGRWYTFTSARPTFYDNSRIRRPEKAPAPWGLPIDMEEMANTRIHLEGAKCNGNGRLSSSSETKGEVTGERKLCKDEILSCYYSDFGTLYREVIEPSRRGWLYEKAEDNGETGGLVFVQAAACEASCFDRAEQRFSLTLLDEQRKEIIVQVTYSKRESLTIRYLERLAKRILEKDKPVPCFVGKAYLEDNRIKLYPIACLERKEIRDGLF